MKGNKAKSKLVFKFSSQIKLIFCCSKEEAQAEKTSVIQISKEQFLKNKMQLGEAEQREFPLLVHASGTVDVPPEKRVVLSDPICGYIKNISLLVGDKVKKGQAIVTIENPEFVAIQQRYMEAKAQRLYLKAEYERQKMMLEEDITSMKNFLKAESAYQTVSASYTGLRKQLSLLNIPLKEV